MSFFSQVIKLSKTEYHNHTLFYPVSFLLGIIIYFSTFDLSLNINWLYWVLPLLALPLTTTYIARKHFAIKYISILILCFSIGGAISALQVYLKQHTRINKEQYADIEGIIKDTKPNNRGGIQVLIKLDSKNKLAAIKNIRITYNHHKNKELLVIGSKIALRAKLHPSPHATIKGGYDFAFHSYFKQIGAIGYAVKPITILETPNQKSFIAKLRQYIHKRLYMFMEKENASILSAIMLGESGGIPSQTLEEMRHSGISHTLCVSGLHLSLIAGISLLFSRVILNCSNYIAFNCNIKLVSGAISLLISFMYLLLTGQQIAATRAFIMTSFLIAAFSFGRGNMPMRSLAAAACVILVLHPEYALHPSFQLSFVAVIALISGFELFQRHQSKILTPIGGVAYKIKLFVLSNLYSSLIATIATAPIVIYHFHIISNYTLLANLLAIPLMSFFIMPLVLLSFFLMLLRLEPYSLMLIEYGTNQLISIAHFTTSLPHPIIYFGSISGFSLLCFIIGFLIISLLHSKLRILGVIPILLASFLVALTPKPDMIFNLDSNIIAIKQDQKLKIFAHKPSNYLNNYWMSWLGLTKATIVRRDIEHYNHCMNIKGHYIAILYKPEKPHFCPKSVMNIHASPDARSIHRNIVEYQRLQAMAPSISITCSNGQCIVK